ncbi:MAG TPA: UvrD-helicase domain-containing protein [Thermoanaerobaculia bacterium]|jgi:superfamily I DNA/RNA helicase|nr:UvrD-helicase domain-containing protein [Thermoanaerobaculia bacterium]
MNEPSHGAVSPPLTEADVEWVCDALRLPRAAFGGLDGKDPRLGILKSSATLDVEACPGSGKTTLLVAKLAILARKWADSRRGLCVLSHTNVARREIEQRLGNTSEGKRLLSYPHFVGTIHGFVNAFLAIPWLRSLGYPVRVIDSGHCEQYRRRLLGLAQFRTLAGYVGRLEADGTINIVSKWCLASSKLDILKENGKPEFKDPTKPAARQLHALGARCLRDGYYRHDELFMWANDLLDKCPDVREAIRARFTMLFMDEVQDNSEEQSALIFRLFVEGANPVLRQRFGDANQAIYQHAAQTEGATTDYFPDRLIRRDIPSSHRFGQEIGRLADPLALEPQASLGAVLPLVS